MVDNLDKLNSSPWSGHSAFMGTVARDWQDQEAVLAYFGSEIQKPEQDTRILWVKGLPSAGGLNWLAEDLSAAMATGPRWYRCAGKVRPSVAIPEYWVEVILLTGFSLKRKKGKRDITVLFRQE